MSASASSSKSTGTAKTTIQDKALSGLGKIIKLLPTGTVFLFQFLSRPLSNNGNCETINKYLTSILIAVCGLSCFFSSFTDSYVGDDGKTHYGIVTPTGLWPSPDSSNVNLSTYKLRFSDFIHAFFSVIVFGALVLLNQDTVRCFYPVSLSTQNTMLQVLPPVVGVISSVVFMLFPNDRHGIGYPSSQSTTQSSKSESITQSSRSEA